MRAGDLSLAALSRRLPRRLGRRIVTVDSHTAGEATRLILGGMPAPPPGCSSVGDARLWIQRERDELRRFVLREPRGHRDLIGAWVTPPYQPDADFGLVFMDARRYPYACGTATVGAITTMIELGLATPREGGRLVVDTPAGLIRARVERDGDQVGGVGIEMVPSCVGEASVPLSLEGGASLEAALVFVGGFLALVPESELPVPLAPECAPELVAFGEAVIAAANAQHQVRHPITGAASTVDGAVLFDPSGHGARRGYGTVVYGAAHLDRSPCGTGTAAKMTLLYERGELALGETYLSEGILGTSFQGELLSEAEIGSSRGVRTRVTASAHITGIHELCLDPERDPFPDGLLLPG